MATDNPYPAPAPLVLADMCAIQAWHDHLDDQSRKLLEWAADVIGRYGEAIAVAARIEREVYAVFRSTNAPGSGDGDCG